MKALLLTLSLLLPLVGKSQTLSVQSSHVRVGTSEKVGELVNLTSPTLVIWKGESLLVGKRVYGVENYTVGKSQTVLTLREGGKVTIDNPSRTLYLNFPAGNKSFIMENCLFTSR